MNTSLTSASSSSLWDNYISILKKYNDFSNRARRRDYWQFFLMNFGLTYGLMFINGLLLGGSTLVAGLLGLFNLVILLPSVAVAIRRMHDVGKNGWYVLVPIYNFILACSEGENRSNEYGADPKQAVVNRVNS